MQGDRIARHLRLVYVIPFFDGRVRDEVDPSSEYAFPRLCQEEVAQLVPTVHEEVDIALAGSVASRGRADQPDAGDLGVIGEPDDRMSSQQDVTLEGPAREKPQRT